MLVAAAVCPHPPLLVPEVAAGAAAELAALRDACDEAVRRMVAASPEVVVIVGAGDTTGELPADAWGTLAGYGVPVEASLGGSRSPAQSPLSLTIGAWLLGRSDWSGPRRGYGVSADEAPGRCARIGAELAEYAERVGLLVMGDGSACRTEKAPGYFDTRAEPFDAAAAAALGKPDADALLALDADVAREIEAAGRAPWQVLAGSAAGGSYGAELLYDDAPYGVGYLVAVWAAA